MTDTVQVTISPQGQLTIPKSWRDILGVKKGNKIIAKLKKTPQGASMIISKLPEKWSDIVSGSGEGLWSDSDNYLNRERDKWD